MKMKILKNGVEEPAMMTKSKSDKTLSLRVLFLVLLVLLAIILCVYMFFLSPFYAIEDGSGTEPSENRKYHIVVVGRSQNESFLTEIFTGAEEHSSEYDCVVELNIPKSSVENESMQNLLDYAAYTNADGVIAYMDEADSLVQVPLNKDKETIPLVTVAQYLPSVSQISYIGTNYSELGRKISYECSTYLHGYGSLIIINTNMENNPNYSILMSSLTTSLSGWINIDTSVVELESSIEIHKRNGLVERKIRNDEVKLIVCLSTEDTIHAAQLLTDMGMTGNIGIIGFGEGSVVEKYLENGVVTELLSIDSQKIGRSALKELFEYIRYGHANNYITADVCVKKAGSL